MKNKEGGEHHIATDHRPMVQGGILTVHRGSIHGGGEAPGGDSSLQQGAGKRSSGAPDLGSAAATEQRRDREKGFRLLGIGAENKKFPTYESRTQDLCYADVCNGRNRCSYLWRPKEENVPRTWLAYH